MEDLFKIYIDRLQHGNHEEIELDTPSERLDLSDKELTFSDRVSISGRAYLAEDQLILQLTVRAHAFLACLMCNDPASIPIVIDNLYHVEPLEEIKKGVYDFSQMLRENILLHIPSYAECHEGHCPQRKEYDHFLKKPQLSTFPFSLLDK